MLYESARQKHSVSFCLLPCVMLILFCHWQLPYVHGNRAYFFFFFEKAETFFSSLFILFVVFKNRSANVALILNFSNTIVNLDESCSDLKFSIVKPGIIMRYLLSISLLCLPLFAICQQSEQHYKIYSTSKQKMVSADDVMADMTNADVSFFGEEHNDSTCHVLELLLFKGLAEKYPGKFALSMEMFETDCQNVLT